jgi:multidrug resistance efflux pump
MGPYMPKGLAPRIGLVVAAVVVTLAGYVAYRIWPFITAKPYSAVAYVKVDR